MSAFGRPDAESKGVREYQKTALRNELGRTLRRREAVRNGGGLLGRRLRAVNGFIGLASGQTAAARRALRRERPIFSAPGYNFHFFLFVDEQEICPRNRFTKYWGHDIEQNVASHHICGQRQRPRHCLNNEEKASPSVIIIIKNLRVLTLVCGKTDPETYEARFLR